MRMERLFFCNDTATTEIYTLSLHDALPIFSFALVRQILITIVVDTLLALPIYALVRRILVPYLPDDPRRRRRRAYTTDRKSTRLNSSHANISYAVFCL